MVQKITVEYTAEQELPAPDEITAYVQRRIEQHLHSIDEITVNDWDLQINIASFTFNGKVKMQMCGSVNGEGVEATLLNINKRPGMSSTRSHGSYESKREYEQRNGATLAFVWMINEVVRSCWRLVFPSESARALGRSFFVGRALQSLEDCIAESCIQLDQAIERPESAGLAQHRSAFWTALLVGLFSWAVAIVWYVLGSQGTYDPVPGVFGWLVMGCGVSGVIYGWSLWTMPKRFFQAEAEGRTFLERSGLRTAGCATTAGGFMVLGSLLIATLGIILLLNA